MLRVGRAKGLREATVCFAWVAVSLFLTPTTAVAQIEGHWSGEIIRAGARTTLLLDFKRANGKIAGSFGLPDQRVLEYPLEKVALAGKQVEIAGPGNAFHITGELSGDGRTIVGTFRDPSGEADVHLERTQEIPPYTHQEVRFTNGNVSLAGSLYVPRAHGTFPAVVFLHGAGNEIRWGASRFLADYFARRGIAALIYDKRGSGESTGDWRKSTFEDLAGDAQAAIGLLQTNPKIDARRIGIYGHSQGGTIAPLVAAKSRTIAFVISAAGAAVPMWKAEIHSLQTQVRNQGVTGEGLKRADAFVEHFVDVVRSGKGREQLASEAVKAKERGEPWATLLSPPPPDSYFWSFYPGIANFDAAQYWRSVTVPVLIIEAGNDAYVPVDESVLQMDAALRQAGNRDYTILQLPGAPHNLVLQPGASSQLTWPQLYPGYADLIAGWVHYRFGRPKS